MQKLNKAGREVANPIEHYWMRTFTSQLPTIS
nr:MAG TPA: hypothetical protein [Caudoviricetes sp.]